MKIKFTDTETFIISSDSEEAKVILDKLIYGLTIQKRKLKLLSTPCPDGTKSLMIRLESEEAEKEKLTDQNIKLMREANERILQQQNADHARDIKLLNDHMFNENCCGFGRTNYRPLGS